MYLISNSPVDCADKRSAWVRYTLSDLLFTCEWLWCIYHFGCCDSLHHFAFIQITNIKGNFFKCHMLWIERKFGVIFNWIYFHIYINRHKHTEGVIGVFRWGILLWNLVKVEIMEQNKIKFISNCYICDCILLWIIYLLKTPKRFF